MSLVKAISNLGVFASQATQHARENFQNNSVEASVLEQFSSYDINPMLLEQLNRHES